MESYAATSMQLGKLLKARRHALNLTRKEAAEKRVLLPKTISMLENTPDLQGAVQLLPEGEVPGLLSG